METKAKALESSQMMKKGLAVIGATLVVIVMAAAALWDFESEGVKLSSLWKQANAAGLIGALLLISTAMPFVALRWRALFPTEFKKQASPIYLTGILCAAFVFNLALPGPVGELISAGMAQKKTKLPFVNGLSALGVSRIIGLGSACAIAGTLYWIAPFETPSQWTNALKVSAGGLCLLAALIGSMILKPSVYVDWFIAVKPKSWTHGIKGKVVETLEDLLTAMVETANRGGRAYFESISWALLGHLFVASGIALAAHSVGVSVSWSAVLFTYAASIAASVAMFMLPASGMAWDMLFATSLKVTGSIALHSAVAITMVVRIQQMLVAIIGLFIVWLMARDMLNVSDFIKKSKKLDDD